MGESDLLKTGSRPSAGALAPETGLFSVRSWMVFGWDQEKIEKGTDTEGESFLSMRVPIKLLIF